MRSSCSLNSGLRAGPKSSASKTWRISISAPSPKGARLTHSIASSFDFTCHSQKPATSSFVSAKGPSVTVRFPPENFTRAPLELAWSPSPASSTPAFSNCWLNLPIAVRIFSSGRTPASESLLAFTRIMNRIVVTPLGFGFGAVPASGLPSRRTRGSGIDREPSASSWADGGSLLPPFTYRRRVLRLMCVRIESKTTPKAGLAAHLVIGHPLDEGDQATVDIVPLPQHLG